MSTEKLLAEGFIVDCPYCKVCSIQLSKEEYTLVEAGQQMISKCHVCDSEVVLNGQRKLC